MALTAAAEGDNDRRLAKGNLALVAQDRQICARRLIVRRLVHEVTPYQQRAVSLSLPT
jgi:hypothetical protein